MSLSSGSRLDLDQTESDFSEEEIEGLQTAIDKRRSLAFGEESLLKLAKQSDYSAKVVEAVVSEVHIQHLA
jgi:hypothetical protein